VPRGPETPTLDLLASFVRSRHDLRPSTLRGYEAGVRRFASTHPQLRDLTAAAANDYILEALRRKRRHLAHHDGRALRVLVDEHRAYTKNLTDPRSATALAALIR